MNRVDLVGRLTADPEVRYTSGENANARVRFTVAVNRKFKNADGRYDADFISCVAWKNQAEFISKYFHKGDPIGINGNIRTGSYTNTDGVKIYTTDVYVDDVEFVGGGRRSDDGEVPTSAPAQTQAKPQQKRQTDTDWMNVPDGVDEEGLPF